MTPPPLRAARCCVCEKPVAEGSVLYDGREWCGCKLPEDHPCAKQPDDAKPIGTEAAK